MCLERDRLWQQLSSVSANGQKAGRFFLKKRPVFEFTQTVGVLECDCMGIGVLFMNARVLLCTVDKWNDQMLLDRGIIKFYVKHISLFFLIYKIL